MTIKDLAAQTGYSVGTVSRVLNHQPHVSERARQVILEAARASDFQLNVNAKQLKQSHGTSLLAICKGTTNALFAQLLQSIQTAMADSAYPLMVDYIDEQENEVLRAVQLCMEKKPLGILFLGGNQAHFHRDFGKISVPCVLVTGEIAGESWPNLSCVSSDDVQAAYLAVDHLAELGHEKIVVIGGSREESDISRLRWQGCQRAFAQRGIPFAENGYETARFSFEDGARAAEALLHRVPGFTALFAMSDTMAIGAIRALKDAGLRVPEDVSVVGFDGLLTGEYTIPRLTTIAQSAEELAAQSLELLRQAVENGMESRHVTVETRLLRRESTARK